MSIVVSLQLTVRRQNTDNSPSNKSTLVMRGDFQTKKFHKTASTWRAQLSVALTTVKLNGFSLLLYQDLSQCWLGKIRKVFSSKSDPSRRSVGSTIFLCAKSGQLPKLVRRKVSMLCAFYRWFFRKFVRAIFYFSWLFPV